MLAPLVVHSPIKCKCLIIDDDIFSTKIIQKFVSNTDFLDLMGTANGGIEAARMLRDTPVDILFLDMEMPDMSGLDLLSTISNKDFLVIVTSASREYAVEAFEKNVIDYLVKPITYPRFLIAAQKAYDRLSQRQFTNTPVADFTFVKVEQKLVKIYFADIQYIEALGDYVHIVSHNKKTIVYTTMKAIANRFPVNKFIRVHRSFIVNLDAITAVEDNNVTIGSKFIPIGATYAKGVLQLLSKF
ncbi:LytR/AlgR family response regulator transcription factor [Adhaeribacter radiodurans]|uniref:Response regulator transcription factor n=1 Tax=Adhaeribacter radiodurans TaxID=2745197 RepID=A0A7L7LAW4_9BACT|nr:LytTR family DNA-binding domain-containing protein [Adhaeribacter radiodurans]QMU29854.1 response regulator transcription factor [Adhaeribacter radiodurans]